MSFNLRLEVILFAVLLLLTVVYFVKKEKITVKYSLVWFSAGLVLLVAAMFPVIMETLAKLLGFSLVSNMMLVILIALLILIIFSLTIIVSGQNEKIKLLIQEVSTLKSIEKKIQEKSFEKV